MYVDCNKPGACDVTNLFISSIGACSNANRKNTSLSSSITGAKKRLTDHSIFVNLDRRKEITPGSGWANICEEANQDSLACTWASFKNKQLCRNR